MTSALYSHYIIDGIPQELTPADILDSVMEPDAHPRHAGGPFDQIVDETSDPGFGLLNVDPAKVDEYLALISDARSELPLAFSAEYTRAHIAATLIDTMWRLGNFRLEDLTLTVKWMWNDAFVCNMAAFYQSVSATADYLDALNLRLRRYSFEEGPISVRFATALSRAPLKCGPVLQDDPQSWLIYVPFDTSDYRLGGSLLAQRAGLKGGSAPKVSDPDYFIDCFEVVREFVEDGVAIAGATVCEGGLVNALSSMASCETGAVIDLSDLMKASDEKNVSRVLFAEVPGVILQIRDMDFDYVDAEFLLQDVAFFPLGHPTPGTPGIHVKASAKSGIQTILESLLQNAEGED